MTNDSRVRFTLRIPERLFEKVKKESIELGVSTNALILQILKNWADKQKEG